MKLLHIITLLLISTISFSQTSTDRSNYVNRMNTIFIAKDNLVSFVSDENFGTPQIIIAFDLSLSPSGELSLSDIPPFVTSAGWDTFETMFDAGFIWICFSQINICYNRDEIIEILWPKNK